MEFWGGVTLLPWMQLNMLEHTYFLYPPIVFLSVVEYKSQRALMSGRQRARQKCTIIKCGCLWVSAFDDAVFRSLADVMLAYGDYCIVVYIFVQLIPYASTLKIFWDGVNKLRWERGVCYHLHLCCYLSSAYLCFLLPPSITAPRQ